MEKVRLNDTEIDAIVKAALDTLGSKLAAVRLHGSRIDLTKKGGDIDLLVECFGGVEDKFALTQMIRQKICASLGQQKVDILIFSQDYSLNTERENIFLRLVLKDSKFLWRAHG